MINIKAFATNLHEEILTFSYTKEHLETELSCSGVMMDVLCCVGVLALCCVALRCVALRLRCVALCCAVLRHACALAMLYCCTVVVAV